MKRLIVLAVVSIICSLLITRHSSLSNQTRNGKDNPLLFGGEWIEVSDEDSGAQLLLPDVRGIEQVGGLGIPLHRPRVWRISKELIESVSPEPVNPKFKTLRFKPELNPDGREGTVDLTILDDDNGKQKKKPRKLLAIFFVKDDYLMICYRWDTRPKRFASSKEDSASMIILRRCKSKPADRDAAKPKDEGK